MVDKWEKAFMETAETFAELSSAKRLKVGAVIVKDKRIISIGYNGMPSGWSNNCEEIVFPKGYNPKSGVKLEPKTRKEVLHAETNAIAKVAMSSESCYNADIYTTTAPCIDCAKLIHQSGIKKVYWRNPHLRSDEGLKFLEKCDMEIEQI
jgi:dCMP deaminase